MSLFNKYCCTDADWIAESSGQLTIFRVDDEPPDPDDYVIRKEWKQAWEFWEEQYPELALGLMERNGELEQFNHLERWKEWAKHQPYYAMRMTRNYSKYEGFYLKWLKEQKMSNEELEKDLPDELRAVLILLEGIVS